MVFKLQIPILVILLFITSISFSSTDTKSDPLAEGKKLPQFTITEGKDSVTFPDDFKGKVFALYFGNILNNQDGFQFMSWGGAFTITLRQGDKSLNDVYFAGIASLKNRPVYWVPILVRKTFRDAMKKNDIRGELLYDWDNEIADKFNIEPSGIRAIIIDKNGVIRRSFDSKIYDLSKEEREKTAKLFLKLINEKPDTEK